MHLGITERLFGLRGDAAATKHANQHGNGQDDQQNQNAQQAVAQGMAFHRHLLQPITQPGVFSATSSTAW